jgi:hypothetical protein
LHIPSKKELAALAFPPGEFAYLLSKTPFRLILDAAEDSGEIYRDLCMVGRLLLDVRDRAEPARASRWPRKSLFPKQILDAETRHLCQRAERNMRTFRRLAAETNLLIQQRKTIIALMSTKRKELGSALRELFSQV